MCPIAHVETDSVSGCVDTKMDGQLANPVCYTRIGKAEILGFSLERLARGGPLGQEVVLHVVHLMSNNGQCWIRQGDR
jgi:hypothetical protein